MRHAILRACERMQLRPCRWPSIPAAYEQDAGFLVGFAARGDTQAEHQLRTQGSTVWCAHHRGVVGGLDRDERRRGGAAVRRIDTAPGEDPHATHEPQCLLPAHHQDLEPRVAFAKQEQGGGGCERSRRSGHVWRRQGGPRGAAGAGGGWE